MSQSKLESLPNEILIDIIEKYINGIDVVVAFNHQLNRRFDGLINRCQQLRFDFTQCRKDDFCVCMGLLPAYLKSIRHLALSDYRTPGQIYAFLSFYRSFTLFSQLRSLSFHFNGLTTAPSMLHVALDSLVTSNVHSLSIEGKNTDNIPALNDNIRDILRMATLKRLILSIDINANSWSFLADTSCDLEELTVRGMQCAPADFQVICCIARRLKYLNVYITESKPSAYRRSKNSASKPILPLLELRTLILTFQSISETAFETLADCIRLMPALQRLEVRTHNDLIHAMRWQTLIETSLPLLTHLTLWTMGLPGIGAEVTNTLESFQSSFWIAKKDFNLIVTEHQLPDAEDHSDQDSDDGMVSRDPNYFLQPVTQVWMAPKRDLKNDFSVIGKISKLKVSTRSKLEHYPRYYPCVNSLDLLYLDKPLLIYLKRYFSCSQIKELTLLPSVGDSGNLSILLAHFNHVRSLSIRFNLLASAGKNAFTKQTATMKTLDISYDKHPFDTHTMRLIAQLFPYLEHLKINTRSINKVPQLKKFFPHLFSLTFKVLTNAPWFDNYNGTMSDYNLRRNAQFLFERQNDFLVIWIDQAAVEDPFWRRCVSTTKVPDKPGPRKRGLFNFLKLFK